MTVEPSHRVYAHGIASHQFGRFSGKWHETATIQLVAGESNTSSRERRSLGVPRVSAFLRLRVLALALPSESPRPLGHFLLPVPSRCVHRSRPYGRSWCIPLALNKGSHGYL